MNWKHTLLICCAIIVAGSIASPRMAETQGTGMPYALSSASLPNLSTQPPVWVVRSDGTVYYCAISNTIQCTKGALP